MGSFFLVQVTIKKARKLLGTKCSDLSDQEVEFRINKLEAFAESLVDATLEKLDTIKIDETSNNFS